MKSPYDVIIRPMLTEKASTYYLPFKKYLFEVHPSANKIEIRKAIEKCFEVKVKSVNVMIRHGKKRRVRQVPGYRKDRKFAIVTLREGEIEVI